LQFCSDLIGRLRARFPGISFLPRAATGVGQSFSRWTPRSPSLPRVPTAYDLVACVHPSLRGILIAGLSVTALLLFGYVYVFSTKGLIARQKFHVLIAERRADNEELRAENAELRQYIARLENDTETIEGYARNELNMVKPEESLYRVAPDGPPAYVLNMPSAATASKPSARASASR
jgi:cell division protein FtsB